MKDTLNLRPIYDPDRRWPANAFVDGRGTVYTVQKVGSVWRPLVEPLPEAGSVEYAARTIRELDRYRARRNDMHTEGYDD